MSKNYVKGTLPEVAVQALEDGCDSPRLRVLAGLDPSHSVEASDLFRKVLSELGVAQPSKREAVLSLAREVAESILNGDTEVFCGAEQIWDLTLLATTESLPELDPFVYAASEWQGRPEDREAFAEGVEAAARDLISEQ